MRVHIRKERFPAQRRTKLHPRGDGPFQVVARINDNAYKLDLPGQYGVSATVNVSDLSPFEFDSGDRDSRTNPFEEESTAFDLQHMELDGLPFQSRWGSSVHLVKANQDLLLSVLKGSVVSSVINVSELAGSKAVY